MPLIVVVMGTEVLGAPLDVEAALDVAILHHAQGAVLTHLAQETNRNNSCDRPTYQVCFKIGHTAERCWHRYDENYVLDFRHVTATATNSYTVDTLILGMSQLQLQTPTPSIRTGTRIPDHITGELEKLSL
jgi:hypothetical protein